MAVEHLHLCYLSPDKTQLGWLCKLGKGLASGPLQAEAVGGPHTPSWWSQLSALTAFQGYKGLS